MQGKISAMSRHNSPLQRNNGDGIFPLTEAAAHDAKKSDCQITMDKNFEFEIAPHVALFRSPPYSSPSVTRKIGFAGNPAVEREWF
jgi:hypothetical protein